VSARRDLLDALLGRAEFELDGRRYPVPEHPVARWMEAALDPGMDAIVPGMLAEDEQRHLYDRLMDDEEPLDLLLCESIGLWVLEQAGGRPWWEVKRALLWGLDSWGPLDGWARTEGGGLDLLSLPLRSYCAVFVRFGLVVTGEESEQWFAEFSLPPLDNPEAIASRPEWADEEVSTDFGSAFDTWSQLANSALPD
jgi:hypothetical protein